MFRFGRRPVKTRAELLRGELGESLGHLRKAATHAAGEVGHQARSAAARGSVAAAGAVASRASVQNLRKVRNLRKRKREREMARKRGFMLAGLLAAGAAVGAVGALVSRRRRQPSWEEYDTGSAAEKARGAKESALDAAATGADRAAGTVSATADKVAAKADQAAAKGDRTASTVAAKADQAAAKGDRAAAGVEKAADKVSGAADTGAEKLTSRNSRP